MQVAPLCCVFGSVGSCHLVCLLVSPGATLTGLMSGLSFGVWMTRFRADHTEIPPSPLSPSFTSCDSELEECQGQKGWKEAPNGQPETGGSWDSKRYWYPFILSMVRSLGSDVRGLRLVFSSLSVSDPFSTSQSFASGLARSLYTRELWCWNWDSPSFATGLGVSKVTCEDKSQSLYNNLGDEGINTGDKPWDTSKVYIRLSSPSLSSFLLLFILNPTSITSSGDHYQEREGKLATSFPTLRNSPND